MSNGLAISDSNQIQKTLTHQQISDIARGIGYNLTADFTPNEYQCLLDRVTKVVSNEIGKSAEENLLRPTVDKILRKVCKVDEEAIDHLPLCVHLWISNVLFPLKFPR